MLDRTLNHLDGDRKWPGPWWGSTFGVLMGLISSGLRGLGVGKKQLPGGELEYADCEEGGRGDGGTRQREQWKTSSLSQPLLTMLPFLSPPRQTILL